MQQFTYEILDPRVYQTLLIVELLLKRIWRNRQTQETQTLRRKLIWVQVPLSVLRSLDIQRPRIKDLKVNLLEIKIAVISISL